MRFFSIILRKLFRENSRYPCGGQRIGGTPHEQTALERQIEAADRQIDALVYELYALTEEEIGDVEGAKVNRKVDLEAQ